MKPNQSFSLFIVCVLVISCSSGKKTSSPGSDEVGYHRVYEGNRVVIKKSSSAWTEKLNIESLNFSSYNQQEPYLPMTADRLFQKKEYPPVYVPPVEAKPDRPKDIKPNPSEDKRFGWRELSSILALLLTVSGFFIGLPLTFATILGLILVGVGIILALFGLKGRFRALAIISLIPAGLLLIIVLGYVISIHI